MGNLQMAFAYEEKKKKPYACVLAMSRCDQKPDNFVADLINLILVLTELRQANNMGRTMLTTRLKMKSTAIGRVVLGVLAAGVVIHLIGFNVRQATDLIFNNGNPSVQEKNANALAKDSVSDTLRLAASLYQPDSTDHEQHGLCTNHSVDADNQPVDVANQPDDQPFLANDRPNAMAKISDLTGREPDPDANLPDVNAHQADRCPSFPLKFSTHDSFFPCEWRPSIPPDCSQRLRPRLSCNASSADIMFEWVTVQTPPGAYNFTDDCLRRVLRERCSEDRDLIPKLVHFVTFGGREMPFYTFLGVLSAARFVQPCLLLFHTDRLPVGKYWDTLLRVVPNILHVKRQPPTEIFGNQVKVVEHMADIARLEAVKTFGGLYIDTDYVLVNPVDDLRRHSVVMGNTIPNYNYCNCVFMGKAGAKFFDLWYDGYRTFNDKVWGYHSTILPYELHKKHPEVPFHAVDTFVRPWFGDIKEKFYKNIFDFKSKHGLHLYVRLNRGYFKDEHYEAQNSSLGQVSRHILFGDSDSCFGGNGLKGEIA